ncbi:MAG TPA: hypothetical protein VLL52_09870 [Anaerolineae bacterium]|nr:hypothetical protein [Anaerolineae bacterium]
MLTIALIPPFALALYYLIQLAYYIQQKRQEKALVAVRAQRRRRS